MQPGIGLENWSAETGQPIPDTAHAISVSLPSWRANLGYEEGEEWVHSKMRSGYPRFYVHEAIQAFADALLVQHGTGTQEALLFPSVRTALQCRAFITRYSPSALAAGQPTKDNAAEAYSIANLVLPQEVAPGKPAGPPLVVASAVLYPEHDASTARKFWQHSGEGMSSRRAEFFLPLFLDGHLKVHWSDPQALDGERTLSKGPRRYQKLPYDTHHRQGARLGPVGCTESNGCQQNAAEDLQYIEERFGRNLNLTLAPNAKQAIRRRIAGTLTANTGGVEDSTDPQSSPNGPTERPSEEDVYLFPTGMSSIFNVHQMVIKVLGQLKCVMFGFPYIDTLKILENFGAGCIFYGYGSLSELTDLERRCENGEKIAALFCEFPGNPLLKTPDLARIREVADKYGFAVVVDETIGNFLNVNVLPWTDVVVSSLTKIFSGDSNVMGGSCVLNPNSTYYRRFCSFLDGHYEDNYWPEDALFMERNSRDFVSRNSRINRNAAALSQLLRKSSRIKDLYYPLQSPSQAHFDTCRRPNGGYGGLLSMTFHSTEHATTFFDTLQTAKGPSLGTNFTISCPFVILAHYSELQWAAGYGVHADLVRVSVGVENSHDLCDVFQRALDVLE